MNQLVKNLVFIDNLLYPKNKSSTKFNFKVSKLANDLDVPSQTLHKWLELGIISKTQLKRIANKIDNLIDLIEITPDKLKNNDLQTEYYSSINRVKDQELQYNIKQLDISDQKLQAYFKKYPKLKKSLLEFLKSIDNK